MKRSDPSPGGRKKRGFARMAAIVALMLVVLSTAAVICVVMFFKTRQVLVSGNVTYSVEEVLSVAQIAEEQNIFTIRTDALEQKIVDAFPYIEQATVKRLLPDTIQIAVEETTASMASINSAESYTLLSFKGRVLEQGSGDAPAGVLLLVGLDLSEAPAGGTADLYYPDEMATLSYLLEAMDQTGFTGVSYIDLSDRLCTELLYDNRVLLSLGTELELSHKLETAEQILTEELDDRFEGTLDLTIVSRAYSWRRSIYGMINSIYRENYL